MDRVLVDGYMVEQEDTVQMGLLSLKAAEAAEVECMEPPDLLQ